MTGFIGPEEAARQLANLRRSYVYAWAKLVGPSPSHPVLRAAQEHEAYLLAIIAEHKET